MSTMSALDIDRRVEDAREAVLHSLHSDHHMNRLSPADKELWDRLYPTPALDAVDWVDINARMLMEL